MKCAPTLLLSALMCLTLGACSDDTNGVADSRVGADGQAADLASEGGLKPTFADVTTVGFGGGNKDYRIDVTIDAVELGCQQYVDWWEVLSLSGALIHRHVLAGPQGKRPFSSYSEHVPIESGVEYVYRAHMFPHGYGGAVVIKTQSGPRRTDTGSWSTDYPELAKLDPQPPTCVE